MRHASLVYMRIIGIIASAFLLIILQAKGGAGEKMTLTLAEAVESALAHNPAFRAQLLQPSVAATDVDLEAAAFDPVLFAQLSYAESASERLARAGSGIEFQQRRDLVGLAGVSAYLPTGTRIEGVAEVFEEDTNFSNQSLAQTRFGVGITQNLLRGFGTGPNLVRLRQAGLDTQSSWFELKASAQVLVAAVETAYWNYLLAQQAVEVVENALDLSKRQLSEIEQRVQVGRLARLNLPAAQAELALQEEALIEAETALQQARLRLVRLVFPRRSDRWTMPLVLLPPTDPVELTDDAGLHVMVALSLRPDLAQARLAWDSRDLELVRTENGLLPDLRVFADLGISGYGRSVDRSTHSINRDTHDWRVGLLFEYPWGNRAARSEFTRARYTLRQATEAIVNLHELIEEEVRTALVGVDRSRRLINATEATLNFARESYEAEHTRFMEGRSTTFQVAQAQQILLNAQIARLRAETGLRLALIELFVADGTLLERRGITLADLELPGTTAQARSFRPGPSVDTAEAQ